ncbi:MAG: protein translocase subunit SecF [Calditrichaeota bacterium]|nr:protein translocase subunit SecF [Calditrichota bacterium]
MIQFFQDSNYKFVKYRYKAITVSALIVLAGIVMTFIKGPNWSIDFRGGLDVQVRFQQDVTDGQVRSALSGLDVGEVKTVSSLGERDDILIRMKDTEDVQALQQEIGQRLTSAFPGNPWEVRGIEVVGPKVGAELRDQAMISAAVALLLLLIYISWRFEFAYAIGAIVALLHDVLVTWAFFMLFGYEISLSVLAAFLTLIGFSLNDTVVVFDRIRENLKKLRQMKLGEIMDLSINETLSRTIITSLTVFLTILVLFVFGGPVLKGFSFAMLVGVITGTYSSVFIAAPVVLEWAERKAIQGKKK